MSGELVRLGFEKGAESSVDLAHSEALRLRDHAVAGSRSAGAMWIHHGGFHDGFAHGAAGERAPRRVEQRRWRRRQQQQRARCGGSTGGDDIFI